MCMPAPYWVHSAWQRGQWKMLPVSSLPLLNCSTLMASACSPCVPAGGLLSRCCRCRNDHSFWETVRKYSHLPRKRCEATECSKYLGYQHVRIKVSRCTLCFASGGAPSELPVHCRFAGCSSPSSTNCSSRKKSSSPNDARCKARPHTWCTRRRPTTGVRPEMTPSTRPCCNPAGCPPPPPAANIGEHRRAGVAVRLCTSFRSCPCPCKVALGLLAAFFWPCEGRRKLWLDWEGWDHLAPAVQSRKWAGLPSLCQHIFSSADRQPCQKIFQVRDKLRTAALFLPPVIIAGMKCTKLHASKLNSKRGIMEGILCLANLTVVTCRGSNRGIASRN